MKKKVLCLFSLILYGLLACTILSTRIQEEMTTLVRVEDRIASKRDPKTISLVLCLFSLILYGLLACTILSTRIQEEMTTLVRVEDRIASKRDPKTISLNRFSLILYGLLACTILSTRIQEEMTTLVRVEDRIASKRDPKTISLNSRSLFEKNRYPIAEDGYYLFEIADRGGWAPGIRTHPVPEYTFQGETAVVYVHIDRNYTFVRAASRNPLPGKLTQPELYLRPCRLPQSPPGKADPACEVLPAGSGHQPVDLWPCLPKNPGNAPRIHPGRRG